MLQQSTPACCPAEAIVRGHRGGLLTVPDYNNLTQCEALDDIKLNLVRAEALASHQRQQQLTQQYTPKAYSIQPLMHAALALLACSWLPPD